MQFWTDAEYLPAQLQARSRRAEHHRCHVAGDTVLQQCQQPWVCERHNFSQLFPEIDDYLALTFRAITNQRQKAALNAVTAATLSNYSTINVQVLQQSNQVEVLGYNLLKKQSNFKGNSEFLIKPTREVSDTLPLVLPVDAGNTYATLEYVPRAMGQDQQG